MAHPASSPHDAVSQLNQRHRSQLLAIARSFGGIPNATDATAVNIDDDGIELDICTTNGRSCRHIPFTGRPDTRSRRLAFRQLARQAARQNNAEDIDVDNTASNGAPGSYSPDQRSPSRGATHGQQH